MRRFGVAAIAAFLVLSACASGAPTQGQAVPDWVLSTPKPDSANTYFVGQAPAPGGDLATGTDDAAANLIASIMQYIGVKVSVDTSASARASLDSYSADIRQTVKTQSNNRLSGFQIKEKYVYADKKSGAKTVYVLAAYATADLEKEKARIQALFQEKLDAVAKPEAAGQSLLAAGRYYEAAQKFIEAAVAASGSDIDNADVKVERNASSARSALSKLRFVKAGDNYKASLGKAFDAPFVLSLVAGEGDAAPGVPGAKLLVSYQRKQGTRTVSKTESAVTDAAGRLSYTPPAPDFVGKAKFLVRLDFQASLDLLDSLPAKYSSYRDALEDEIQSKRAEIAYEVSSAARSVPTAVALVDLDDAGTPIVGARTEAGLVEALVKEKFDARSGGLDASLVAKMDDATILAAAKAAPGKKFGRLVYGTAKITGVRKDGSMYLADSKASVKVVELATGTLLYSAEKAATGMGSDEATARAAAYRELGLNAIGKDLLASLP
jgi:hypothetical protein